MDRGIETFIRKLACRVSADVTVPLLNSHVEVVFFVLQCQVACCPMLLALVDEEMERELMGRDEVPPPVAIEVPTLGEPTSEEWRHHGLTHLPHQSWCNVCV